MGTRGTKNQVTRIMSGTLYSWCVAYEQGNQQVLKGTDIKIVKAMFKYLAETAGIKGPEGTAFSYGVCESLYKLYNGYAAEYNFVVGDVLLRALLLFMCDFINTGSDTYNKVYYILSSDDSNFRVEWMVKTVDRYNFDYVRAVEFSWFRFSKLLRCFMFKATERFCRGVTIKPAVIFNNCDTFISLVRFKNGRPNKYVYSNDTWDKRTFDMALTQDVSNSVFLLYVYQKVAGWSNYYAAAYRIRQQCNESLEEYIHNKTLTPIIVARCFSTAVAGWFMWNMPDLKFNW